jgi:malate synthase
VLLVRNVGHLMTNPAILLTDGRKHRKASWMRLSPALIAMHDLKGLRPLNTRNSRAGSIYIVKPKMHGPEEWPFTNDLFDAVEDMLGLARHTIKVGVMDEERRTSANLAACIQAVKHRIVFINTGFLDRTGDEIHTSMQAGPMIRKGDMKASAGSRPTKRATSASAWQVRARHGKAQIGKGMWAAPDRWPTCWSRRSATPGPARTPHGCRRPPPRRCTPRTITRSTCSAVRPRWRAAACRRWMHCSACAARRRAELVTNRISATELDNNAQGILGYVVRWVDQGVGCSKVPDIHDIGLMEDRATLRISSASIWPTGCCTGSARRNRSMRRCSAWPPRSMRRMPAIRCIKPVADQSG